jgi:hypothetical protein
MLSGMKRLKQTAIVSGVLALLAGVAALWGPFITGEAVEGTLERLRLSLPRRRSGQPHS